MLSSRQLPYAPTPYSYTPNTAVTASINLDQEVTLSHSSAERDLNDSLAEIYSIIVTLDGLERAYNKDSIPETEYTDLCNRLLKQYAANLQDEAVRKEFEDLETFKSKWEIECPRATERLRVNLPSTVTSANPFPAPTGISTPVSHPPLSHRGSGVPNNNKSTHATPGQIATATENWITLLDALKLNISSKDQLHPLLADLIQSVNKVTDRDFVDRERIIEWLKRLNGMRAGQELGAEEKREMEFEMEGAYRGFKDALT